MKSDLQSLVQTPKPFASSFLFYFCIFFCCIFKGDDATGEEAGERDVACFTLLILKCIWAVHSFKRSRFLYIYIVCEWIVLCEFIEKMM